MPFHRSARFGAALGVCVCVAGSMLALGPISQDGSMGPYPAISRPSDFRELAVAVRGRVGHVTVRPGDEVEPGQELLRLEDAVQQRNIEIAALQAGDDSRVRNAKLTLEHWKGEVELTERSLAEGGASETELRDARLRLGQAGLALEAAKTEREEAAVSLERERARLDEMRVVSPIAGTVLEVHKRPGETADEQTKVITVIATDPLWLEVNVPTRDALRLRTGQPAVVRWQDVDGVEPMPGRIIFVSPAGHGGARQVQVRVEVANPDGLPSGLHGDVIFERAAEAAAGQG